MSIFSFRAECRYDIDIFLTECKNEGICIEAIITPDVGFPDCEVEITADSELETLRNIMKKITDAHVMVQTLRACPLKDNSLERDYDL